MGLLAAALGVHAALTAAGLAAYVAVGGHLPELNGLPVSSVLHGTFDVGRTAARDIALGFALVNLACGVLALIPIPPLEMGVILWSRIPRTPGPRRMKQSYPGRHPAEGVPLPARYEWVAAG